jgi:hypothetical protein
MNLITAKAAGPMSLVLFGLLCATAQGQPSPSITGNNASCLDPGGAPATIGTTDFPTGPTVAFKDLSANTDCNNGRGVLVLGNLIYYTTLTIDGFQPTDKIRIAPFNGGLGGKDIGSLPNPRPGCGVQDLAYHGGYIYALTGYSKRLPIPCSHRQVFKIAVVGGKVSQPVIIPDDPDPDAVNSDGFTILENNGVLTFLINTGDGSCTYKEYNSTTGAATGKGLVVSGFGFCTGVDTADSDTNGTHVLYFSVNGGQLQSATLSPSWVLSPGTIQTPGDGWQAPPDTNPQTVEDISLVHGFGGTPGDAACLGLSLSELVITFGGMPNAASALGYASVNDLLQAIGTFCGD